MTISDGALRVVIREYTREAGVRNLERRIADLLPEDRARDRGGQRPRRFASTRADTRPGSGPRRVPSDPRKRTADPGVATGLAFTPVGGDVLFIEATAYPGKGTLTITGQLGEVMQESAQAALSWVRSHTESSGLPENWFAEHDVHIHVPAGAVPTDGPSAGITIATAIASLVRGVPVADDLGDDRRDHAHGSQVLPIGGVREKVLAAQRYGLKPGRAPKENRARPRRASTRRLARSSVHPRRLDRGGAGGRVRPAEPPQSRGRSAAGTTGRAPRLAPSV